MFGGQAVQAYIADGSEKFRKAHEKEPTLNNEDEVEGEEQRRLDQFGSWLERTP
jgi:HIV Tat-specific factor 1